MKRQKINQDRRYIDLVELTRANWSYRPYECTCDVCTSASMTPSRKPSKAPSMAPSRKPSKAPSMAPSMTPTIRGIRGKSRSVTSQRSVRSTFLHDIRSPPQRSQARSNKPLWVTNLQRSLVPSSQQAVQSYDLVNTIIPVSRQRLANSMQLMGLTPILPKASTTRSILPNLTASRNTLRSYTKSRPISLCGVPPRPIFPNAVKRRSSRISQMTNSSRRSQKSNVKSIKRSSSRNVSKMSLDDRPTTSSYCKEVLKQQRSERASKHSNLKPRRSTASNLPKWINRAKSTLIPFPTKQGFGPPKRRRRSAHKRGPQDRLGDNQRQIKRSVRTQYGSGSDSSVGSSDENYCGCNEDERQESPSKGFGAACNLYGPVQLALSPQLSSIDTASEKSSPIVSNASMRSELNSNEDIVDLAHKEQSPSDTKEEPLDADVTMRNSDTDTANEEGDASVEKMEVGRSATENETGENVVAVCEMVEEAEAEREVEVESELQIRGRIIEIAVDTNISHHTPTNSDEEAGGDGHHNDSPHLEIQITLNPPHHSEDTEDDEATYAATSETDSDF